MIEGRLIEVEVRMGRDCCGKGGMLKKGLRLRVGVIKKNGIEVGISRIGWFQEEERGFLSRRYFLLTDLIISFFWNKLKALLYELIRNPFFILISFALISQLFPTFLFKIWKKRSLGITFQALFEFGNDSNGHLILLSFEDKPFFFFVDDLDSFLYFIIKIESKSL